MRKVRKLRHWKQRFDKGAEFIWRRPLPWNGETVKAGSPIPDDLKNNLSKLRRFWESGVIELAQFEEPDVVTGQKAAKADKAEPVKTDDRQPEELVSKETDRKWRVEGLEEVFPSKTKALEAAEQLLRTKAEDTEDTDMLLGSSVQPSELDVHGETVTLGEVVERAFEESGLTVEEWNGLEDADREARVQQAVDWMTDLGEEEVDEDFLE